jgi:hypothetical protein
LERRREGERKERPPFSVIDLEKLKHNEQNGKRKRWRECGRENSPNGKLVAGDFPPWART